jgi:hypothetical protein
MKHPYFLLLISCTPVVSTRSTDHAFIVTNRSGSVSCINSSCCFPYKHHRDIDKAAAMICIHEKANVKQISEGGLPLTEVDLGIRIVYDETKVDGSRK